MNNKKISHLHNFQRLLYDLFLTGETGLTGGFVHSVMKKRATKSVAVRASQV